MDITTLPESLEAFTGSFIPAFVQAGICASFVYFFFGRDRLSSWRRAVGGWQPAVSRWLKSSTAKEAEIPKHMLVFIAGAILVGVLLLERTVIRAGALIPGALDYSEPTQLIHSLPPTQLAKFWTLYPKAEDEYMLYNVFQQQVSAASAAHSQDSVPWKYAAVQVQNAKDSISAAKLYLLLGLICCLFYQPFKLQGREVWLRFLIVGVFATLIIVRSVFLEVDGVESMGWSKMNYLLADKVSAGKEWEDRLSNEKAQQAFYKRLEAWREHDEKAKLRTYSPVWYAQ